MAGIAIIFVHIFANTGLSFFSYRELRKQGQSSFLYHFLAPIASSILGVIVVVYSLYFAIDTYITAPTSANLPYLVAPVIGVIWSLVIGSVLSVYYVLKKKDILAKAGRYDSEQILGGSGQ